MLVIYSTVNGENYDLNFKVLCLTFGNFSRLTAVKVYGRVSGAVNLVARSPTARWIQPVPDVGGHGNCFPPSPPCFSRSLGCRFFPCFWDRLSKNHEKMQAFKTLRNAIKLTMKYFVSQIERIFYPFSVNTILINFPEF